jgi:hypothetical protein
VLVTPGPDAAEIELHLLDIVPAQASIRTGSGSEVVLALNDGRRFRVAAGSRIVVAASGLQVVRGKVEPLPVVPAMVELAPIEHSQTDDLRPAAVRIRGDELTPEQEAARVALEEQYEASQDASLLVLLIGVDAMLDRTELACRELDRLARLGIDQGELSRVGAHLDCPPGAE